MKQSNCQKIIIADDHAVLREGLIALLSTQSDWKVVAEAQDGLELLEQVTSLSPNLVILDLAMPKLGGIAAIEQLQKLNNKPAILVLSASNDKHSAIEALLAGASGFIPKSAGHHELIFALESILKGQKYISPMVCAEVLEQKQSAIAKSKISSLSPRELEIAELLSAGSPNREIAKKLSISTRTVDTHRANILKKLGIASNVELARLFEHRA